MGKPVSLAYFVKETLWLPSVKLPQPPRTFGTFSKYPYLDKCCRDIHP